MNLEEYEIMFNVEDHHWWYVGLRAMLQDFWGRHVTEQSPRVLDVGCGTGAVMSAVASQAKPTGVDLAPEAIHFCRKRGHTRSAAGSATALPFASESFDAAVMFDVLNHKSIVDKAAPLREVHRVLRPGGVILANIPAFQWLLSSHDMAVHTDRRFTKGEMVSLLEKCSFEVLETTYWNTILFPPIALVRLWRKLKPSPASDLEGEVGGICQRIFSNILSLERRFVRTRPLPFGLSIFAAARKT